MSLIEIVGSINKIAIGAFFITFFFIIWEIYRVFKVGKKDNKPVIPDYVESKYSRSKQTSPAYQSLSAKSKKRSNKRMILYSALIFIVFISTGMAAGLVYLQNDTKTHSAVSATSPLVEYVSSDGIVLYDASWNKIESDRLNDTFAGQKIYVGIADIRDIEISKARIRMNKQSWESTDETTEYNQDLNIYYKEFTVPEGIAGLKIEAELFNQDSGWLNQ